MGNYHARFLGGLGAGNRAWLPSDPKVFFEEWKKCRNL